MLVAWAGRLPAELDEKAAASLRATRIVRVLGTRDEMASPEAVSAEDARFAQLGLAADIVRFDGGHELNVDVLADLA